MRPEAVDLWGKLEANRGIFFEKGLPGTERSFVIWAWACWRAYKYNEAIIWLRCTIGACHIVRLFGKFGISSYECVDGLPNFIELNLSVNNKKEDGDFSLTIIVDGINEGTIEVIGCIMTKKRNHKVIFTSFCYFGLSFRETMNWCRYEMKSWSLDQYRKACEDDKFYDRIRMNLIEEDCSNASLPKDELIRNKYFLAGCNVHWMFGMSIKDAMNDLTGYAFKGFARYLLMGNFHKATCLLACFENDGWLSSRVMVSEYATQWVTFKMCNSLSDLCAFLECDVVRKHPDFKKWVVGLEFLVNLCAGSSYRHSIGKIKVWEQNGTVEEWPVTGCDFFDPTKLTILPSTDWHIPEKYRQGSYDFVQFISGDSLLRVIQVAREKEHSYHLQYVVELLNAIGGSANIRFLDIVLLYSMHGSPPLIKKIDGGGPLHAGSYMDYSTKVRWTPNHIRLLCIPVYL